MCIRDSHVGDTAPKAAGVIHTDFEKGFIRAQTIAYDDFIACKGEAGAKMCIRDRIFRSARLRRDTPPIPAADWRPGLGHNDLEAVACALYPEVARYLDWLRQHGDARMSGSGACCFVGFADESAARAALAALPADMRGFVAAGVDRHPLADIWLS